MALAYRRIFGPTSLDASVRVRLAAICARRFTDTSAPGMATLILVSYDSGCSMPPDRSPRSRESARPQRPGAPARPRGAYGLAHRQPPWNRGVPVHAEPYRRSPTQGSALAGQPHKRADAQSVRARVGRLPGGRTSRMRPTAGTNRDAMRPHNLGVVLRHVHRHGAVSRTALTARMGLTRGTIGDLLAELESLGAVAIVTGPQAALHGRSALAARDHRTRRASRCWRRRSALTTSARSGWAWGARSWRGRRARRPGHTSRTRSQTRSSSLA